MFRFTGLLMLCLGAIFAVPGLVAEEGGFKFPNLNPFRSDDTETSRERVVSHTTPADDSSSGFSWPTLPKPTLPALPKPSFPKWSLPTASGAPERKVPARSNEPSAWDKFSEGTRSFYTRTKQTLMPWSESDEPAARTASGAPRRATKPGSRTKAKATKTSFLPSWLTKEDEEKAIKTPNDFLALPRVPFE